MDVRTYLSKYFDEETSLFVCKLSQKPTTDTVAYTKGTVIIEVDEDRKIRHLPLYFHEFSHNEVMYILNELDIGFKSIDMLPLYKVPKNLEDAVVVCPKTNNKFYF